MIDTIERLGQLLDPGGAGLKPSQLKLLDTAMTMAKAALALVPASGLADLAQGVAAALQPVLDLKLGDVLAGAWNTRRELRKYRDTKQYPSDEVVEHPLGQDTVTSTLEPKVEILLNGQRVPGADVDFTVTLTVTIDSAVLRIRNARIIGATIAKCTGSGSLKCGEAGLLECSTREFTLPAVAFGAGVEIT